MKTSRTYYTIIFIVGIILFQASCKEETQKKMPPPQIQVINAIQQDVPLYQEFVGQLYGLLDIPIRARVEGYLEGIHFDEGLPVKKGQLLYTIDSQPYLAEVKAQEGKLAETRTYLVNAENELKRYEPLAEINAVSKSDLDAARATKEAAEASVSAAVANLRMAQINYGYCTIKSPISGLIGKTEAREGEFVGRNPNPVILNVVSRIDSIRVQFFITEAQYLVLVRELAERRSADSNQADEPDQKAEIELILADGTIYPYIGIFDFIDRNINVSTGSIMVQAIFQNPGSLLRPGMFAKVRVKMETASNAILVPQRCVIELQGQYSVFAIEEGNVVKSRQIEVGPKIGDLWLIKKGLDAEDQVVIDGLQKVASGMVINPVPTSFESKTNH